MEPENRQTKAYKFLLSHELGVISTVSDEGELSSAVIYYFSDDDFNIYFVTKSNTQKYRNIAANGKIALTIYDEPKRFTLQARGTASEVKEQDTQSRIMNHLAKVRGDSEHAWFPPVALLEGGDYALLKVHLDHIQIADYANFRKVGSDVVEDVRS